MMRVPFIGAPLPWWVSTVVLIFWFFAGALLFCTSMLSTTTITPATATDICTGVQLVGQVVVVVIDAVRPDFILSALRPYARHGGSCTLPRDGHAGEYDPYTGHTLTYIENALKDVEDASQGFFLVADAPTTTAQRIKAIATGTMPAFLEAGSNFNSDATEIDSIVRQMKGRAVMLGDDTWTKLFPNSEQGGAGTTHWKYTVAIPSFDVADFHTNDDAVLDAVFSVLSRETPEAATSATEDSRAHAELIIAHFLGVDHVGHRINSENSEMDSKLAQLNVMLRNVSRTLALRDTAMGTVLLVLGDHGMTNSGDHGGDSAQETDTFLFAQHFKGRRGLLSSQQQVPEWVAEVSTWAAPAERAAVDQLALSRSAERLDEELVRLESCREAAGISARKLGAAYQVDVTPTIAVLLGKPIPFSSFGRVLPEVIKLADADADISAVEHCNLVQLERYFDTAKVSTPAASENSPHTTANAHGGSGAVRRRIAQLSLFARRTRADMHQSGMFVGSWMVLTGALLLLCIPAVAQCFHVALPISNWAAFVMVVRLCAVFSNSFIINEDVEVAALLATMLLVLLLANTRSLSTFWAATRNASWRRRAGWWVMAAAVVSLRVLAPYVLRHRAHITHIVESASTLDAAIAMWPAVFRPERVGIVVAALLAVVLYARGLRDVVFCAFAMVVLCAAYHVPVVHHIAPIVIVVLYFLWSRMRHLTHGKSSFFSSFYAYLVLVMWAASLCNERCVAAVMIAIYGVCLPALVEATCVMPTVAQAVTLHLAATVAFFMEGHQCMLNVIDWNSSFVGMPGYSMIIGGALVLMRTFNAFIFLPIACALADTSGRCDSHQNGMAPETSEEEKVKKKGTNFIMINSSCNTSKSKCETQRMRVVRHLVVHFSVALAAVSCFSAYIQKRHLMLYPIFCPKLLFDVVISLLTGAGFIISLLI